MKKLMTIFKSLIGKKQTHEPWCIYDGFDKGEVFQRDILPFIKRAGELCKQHKIPYLFWTIPVCITDGKGNARGQSYTDMWTDRQIAKRMRLFGAAASGRCSAEALARGILNHSSDGTPTEA